MPPLTPTVCPEPAAHPRLASDRLRLAMALWRLPAGMSLGDARLHVEQVERGERLVTDLTRDCVAAVDAANALAATEVLARAGRLCEEGDEADVPY